MEKTKIQKIYEALSIVNSNFIYKKDIGLDKWKILNDGNWSGDCEDYAITTIWLYSDKKWTTFLWNLISFKFVIWYCVLPNGLAHAATKFDGKYFDNIQAGLVSKETLEQYDFYFPIPFPVIFAKMIIALFINR